MKITYDKQADAAYVMFADRIHDGEAATQLHSIETPGGKGEVTLDFDRNGKLLGMEILGAEKSFSLKSWRVLSRWRPIQKTAPTDLGSPNTIRYRPNPMGPPGPEKASLHARPTGQRHVVQSRSERFEVDRAREALCRSWVSLTTAMLL